LNTSNPTGISFVGRIPASKSILNRLLIIQSYQSGLQIVGDSDCDDVVLMKAGLQSLLEGKPMECGQAGTVLRFLALRASRVPGKHILRGHATLMARPQQELVKILGQLGVQVTLEKDQLIVDGDGWRPQGDTLHVPVERSSQFVSGVLLNSWQLPFDLYVTLGHQRVSEGYWKMTQKMCETMGLGIDRWDQDFRVMREQSVLPVKFQAEVDMSSAFSLAAVAAIKGSVTLLDFPRSSIQPDFVFLNILQTMGVPARNESGTLKVSTAEKLLGISVDLKSSPDLFPSLCVLCALAEGESELYGAPHLQFKESNRLEHLVNLVRFMGREIEPTDSGVKIRGPKPAPTLDLLRFDPQGDHRLAMAASILRFAGYNIEILHPEVVTKSFPGFWQALGWSP
jgi:3-phosphoshikimate 1-carboxyvinyltransferase